MLDITLTYSSDDGPQEISIGADRTSFGRAGDVDHRINDEGLSRLHATVYRDGDNVWVVDENSTNGTFVNGEPARSAGTPLRDGDIIRIGNHTNMRVSISQRAVAATASPVSTASAPSAQSTASPSSPMHILPIVLIAGAFFVITITAVVVGFTVFGSSKPAIVQTRETDPEEEDPVEHDPKSSPTPKTTASTEVTSSPTNTSVIIPDDPGNSGPKTSLPAGKKYPEMSDAEKRQYIEAKAMRVAQIIGNSSSEQIPPAAVDRIKSFVDAYASRTKVQVHTGICRFSDNLQATYERASKDAPFINRAFNAKGIDARIGLYLAMIESEHCVCLQSSTGPLGMFQFTYATAKLHFDPNTGIVKGATISNPDDRCKPEPAAHAAASYMKALTGRYGTGPSSVPLAIASYNSGEGGLSTNLQTALQSGQGLDRNFWTLIANMDILNKQFKTENFKYVPKFFAAAIIGENPQDFGLNLQPISTYTK